jgi:hypothetical protein
MASLPVLYALRILQWPLTRIIRLLPSHGARWKPSDLFKELRKVSASLPALYALRIL